MERRLRLPYEAEKGREATLYIIERFPVSIPIGIYAVLYEADRLHLSHFGRMIAGGDYYHTIYGVIHAQIEFDLDGILKLRRQANLDQLSESDTECIDKVLASCPPTPIPTLPPDTVPNAIIPLESIVATLEDGALLLDYLTNRE